MSRMQLLGARDRMDVRDRIKTGGYSQNPLEDDMLVLLKPVCDFSKYYFWASPTSDLGEDYGCIDFDNHLESCVLSMWKVIQDSSFTRKQIENKRKLPDYKARLKLSQLIGLSDVPDINSDSIDRLSGIASEKTDREHIDSVELIRNIRDY